VTGRAAGGEAVLAHAGRWIARLRRRASVRRAAIPAHRHALQDHAVLRGGIAVGVGAQVRQAHAIRARRNALAAGRRIDGAAVRGARGLRLLAGRVAADVGARVHGRGGGAGVHQAVAVVVEAVADFGRGANLAFAHEVARRAHVGAVLVAGPAGRRRAGRKRHSVGTGVGEAAVAFAHRIVVDDAVEVVVEAVAELRLWRGATPALLHAIGARQMAGLALAHGDAALRRAGAHGQIGGVAAGPARRADAAGRVGRVGRAGPDAPRLVDDAVAVVVHAVANFGRARRRRR